MVWMASQVNQEPMDYLELKVLLESLDLLALREFLEIVVNLEHKELMEILVNLDLKDHLEIQVTKFKSRLIPLILQSGSLIAFFELFKIITVS